MKFMTARFWPAWLAVASFTAGCVVDSMESTTLDEVAEGGSDLSFESTGKPVECTGCAPPFVERRGEMELSGELIVRPAKSADAERNRRARARIAADVLRYHPEVDEYVVRVPARGKRGEGENQVAAALLATGDYEYVTPNWVLYPSLLPNDPQYLKQWHHSKIQATLAWSVQKGSPSMIVAFTDTGIDKNHPDLAPNRVPGYNSASDLAEVDGGDVSDVLGHGTHVAGCAAAIGNNALGVSGVGWSLELMMVRVTNQADGSALLDDILQGARWAADNGARVVSTSYSGVDAPSVQATGAYIKSKDALYLYAAGNDNRNLTGFDHADVIVVGASDVADAKASFSSYGKAIDVFAPGVSIYSTMNNGAYGYMSGTSMATPVAGGTLALIWSVNPLFTASQVEGFLYSTAKDLGTAGNDSTYGWGRVSVNAGVSAARAVACTHDRCADGAALGAGCDPCTTAVCELDPHCCDTAWDAACVQAVTAVCNVPCL